MARATRLVLPKTRQPLELPALAVSLVTAMFFVLTGLVVASELPRLQHAPAVRPAVVATPVSRTRTASPASGGQQVLPDTPSQTL
jgi:hypothetical protein